MSESLEPVTTLAELVAVLLFEACQHKTTADFAYDTGMPFKDAKKLLIDAELVLMECFGV